MRHQALLGKRVILINGKMLSHCARYLPVPLTDLHGMTNGIVANHFVISHSVLNRRLRRQVTGNMIGCQFDTSALTALIRMSGAPFYRDGITSYGIPPADTSFFIHVNMHLVKCPRQVSVSESIKSYVLVSPCCQLHDRRQLM